MTRAALTVQNVEPEHARGRCERDLADSRNRGADSSSIRATAWNSGQPNEPGSYGLKITPPERSHPSLSQLHGCAPSSDLALRRASDGLP